jgi:hypothetical protein
MTLLRTVVATLPVKDDHQPAIGRALNVVGADATMLLAVGHHNAQFIRISLDGVFLSVHGAEAEYGDPCDAICQRLGHPRQSQRAALIAREKCPRSLPGLGLARSCCRLRECGATMRAMALTWLSGRSVASVREAYDKPMFRNHPDERLRWRRWRVSRVAQSAGHELRDPIK